MPTNPNAIVSVSHAGELVGSENRLPVDIGQSITMGDISIGAVGLTQDGNPVGAAYPLNVTLAGSEGGLLGIVALQTGSEVSLTSGQSIAISGTPTVDIGTGGSVSVSTVPAITIATGQSISLSGTSEVSLQTGSVVGLAAGNNLIGNTGLYVAGAAVSPTNAVPTKIPGVIANADFILPATGGSHATGTLLQSQPTLTCAITDTSPSITVPSATGLWVGMAVTGTGIPDNSVITNITGTTVTINNNCTATNASASLVFTAATLIPVTLGAANQFVDLKSARIVSNNGSASTKLNAQIHVFSVNNPQATVSDGTAYSASSMSNACTVAATFAATDTSAAYGSSYYAAEQTATDCIVQLDANGRVYLAVVVVNAAYTTANNEQLRINLRGLLL